MKDIDKQMLEILTQDDEDDDNVEYPDNSLDHLPWYIRVWYN